MLVNLSSYALGYPRPCGDRVTNIRGRGLYEGDSLKNHYPRGGGGGGDHSRGGVLSRKYGNHYLTRWVRLNKTLHSLLCSNLELCNDFPIALNNIDLIAMQ